MEVGRRKKEEAVIAMVSALKNFLTVFAVAIGGKNGNNDGKDDNKKLVFNND